MSAKNKFLMTQSLLTSWGWALARGETDEFLSTLRREENPKTKAMLDGIRFENVLQAVMDGQEIQPDHEWYKPIRQLSRYLAGSQYQVKLYRDITVQGVDFLCYGVLDFLKAGIVYDTKFSKTYQVGKYLHSPQHPMYFYICPEAYEFQYLICDGTWVYKEAYRPDDTEPIDRIISRFMDWMDNFGLFDLYVENWKSK